MADKKTDFNTRTGERATGSSRRRQGGSSVPGGLIALVLILVLAAVLALVYSNRKKQEAIAASEAESRSIEASIAAAEAEAAANKIELKTFTPCEIPELQLLVQEYFAARLAGDTTRILELFGRSDTSPDATLESKLKAQAAWIQNFRNISISDVEGVTPNDRLCLVEYEIDFRRTDTLAPGIMYFYAERNADGEYHFVENLIKDRVDFVEMQLAGEQASDMISDTDARLKEALDSDSELALIYTSFGNGEIYKESNLDIDREQEVDLFLDPMDSILVEGVELPAAPAEGETAPAESEAAAVESEAAPAAETPAAETPAAETPAAETPAADAPAAENNETEQ